MNKKFSKFIALLSAGIMAFSFASCSENSEQLANITVKSLFPTDKTERTQNLSDRENGKIEISLSKGESEGDQFAVITDNEFSGYTFTVSDLKSGDNVLSKDCIEISKMIYTECNDRHDSGKKAAGWYADAVVPMKYIINAEENVMEKDINNLFWVDVSAPKDIPAGIYTGNIVLNYQDKNESIPVSVEVYDFTIRDLPYMQTAYSIWLDGNFMMYGELQSNDEIYMRYYDTLLKYNVTSPLRGDNIDEFIGYVKSYYNKITALRLPVKYIGTTRFDEDYYTEVLTKLAFASLEDGVNYFEKAYHRLSTIYDEYQDVSWRTETLVKNTIEKVDVIEQNVVNALIESHKISDSSDELAQSILNLRHNMTAYYDVSNADFINMYCSVYDKIRSNTADVQQMTDLIENHDVVFWTYGCIKHDAYPNPTSQINDYLVSARDLFWFNYEYDIKGDLFWCVNQYCNAGVTVDGLWKPHPDLYEDASHDRLTNGDGYLLYPGVNYGSDYPFPSHRLIVRRDGIDDHTYLSMLGEKYKELGENYGADIKDAKSFASFMNTQLLGRGASKLSDSGILFAREQVANAIVLSDKTGLILDSINVDVNALSYRIYTDGSDLKINGQQLSGSVQGNGKVYSGQVQLNSEGKILIAVIKDGVEYQLSLTAPVEGNIIIDAESDDSIKALKVDEKYNSYVELCSEFESIMFGNCARVVLTGYDFTGIAEKEGYNVDQLNAAYMPSVKFDIVQNGKDLSNISSIEFYVYNEQEKDITVEVFVEGSNNGMNVTVSYDKIILYAKTRTKVVVDNFNVISLKSETWRNYSKVGFRVNNLLNTDKTAYSLSFLVDQAIIRY